MPPAAFSPLGRAHILLRMLRPSKLAAAFLREPHEQEEATVEDPIFFPFSS